MDARAPIGRRATPAARGAGGSAPDAPLGYTVLIVFVIACAILGDRAVLGISTGGRGAFPLLSFVAPVAAVVTIARYGTRRTLGFTRSPVFLVAVMPYLLLTAVLPVLGIVVNGYPERTLIAITEASTAFSFLVLGAALAPVDLRSWRPWLLLAIVVQLIYGIGQLTYLARGPGWELFGPFHDWDLSLQALYGDLVQARGTGLYFNPNELGLWAAVCAVLAWTILAGRLRFVGVTLALLTLLVSQSRGATVAIVAAAVVGVILATIRGRTSIAGSARTALSLGVAAGVAVVLVVAVEPSQGIVDRFSALVAVFIQGPRADANLAGRLDYWSAVIGLNALYPWGTWGSPELLLGTAIDSSWFRLFAQGSVVYVAAFVFLLASPFALRSSKVGDMLVVLAVIIAVAGLTQTPLGYPVIIIFWALLGSALQSSVAERAARPASAYGNGPPRPTQRPPRRSRGAPGLATPRATAGGSDAD